MTNAEAIAASQMVARHVYDQLERSMRFQMNPSKVKCRVKAMTDILHRACLCYTFTESDKAIETCLAPLFDAKGVLTEAIMGRRLNRDLVLLAMRQLKRICDQIESN